MSHTRLAAMAAILSSLASLTGAVSQSSLSPAGNSRDAVVTLYRDPIQPCATSEDRPWYRNTIRPINVCSVGTFPLDDNVYVGDAGRCENGQKPVVEIYGTSDCTGPFVNLVASSEADRCLGRRLWDDVTLTGGSDGWSIRFRCADMPMPTSGAAVQRLGFDAAQVSDADCDAPRATSETRASPFVVHGTAAIQSCYGLEAQRRLDIHRSAQCPDGSEARLARWAAPGCAGEPMSVETVQTGPAVDSLHGWCQSWPMSYAFVCDGGDDDVVQVMDPSSDQQLYGAGIFFIIALCAIFFVRQRNTEERRIMLD